RLAYQLAGQLIQDKADEATEGEKRKGESDRGGRGDNRREHNRRQNQRRGNAGAMTNAAPNNIETCQKCKNKRHAGDCWKCTKCENLGHRTERCRTLETGCYNCNEKGHKRRDYPKLGRNRQGGNNRGGNNVTNLRETPSWREIVSFTVLANPHIKSRLKTLKGNLGAMHDMTHPKATGLRYKPFIYYHKLSTIFGKNRTIGSQAEDLGEEVDGPFQPKTAKGDAKPKSQWTPDERRMVFHDQRLKSIIMSCLPDDIMESDISCVLAKEKWTDLVHRFEGPSDTNENRIMDLKLKYQTFRTKSTESLSQTYSRYKTLLNELANDGVNLSKHKINTLDLADIYGRFVYDDNLIQRRYSETKKARITTPLSCAVSTAFFSNNVIRDFKENFDDEVDDRSSEEYLRDLEIEYHERALLAN
nr:retrovirus-related Pol polyprotein from transposon TNT 1-94 [Tanacetum cinerariifolium]